MGQHPEQMSEPLAFVRLRRAAGSLLLAATGQGRSGTEIKGYIKSKVPSCNQPGMFPKSESHLSQVHR